MDLGRVSEGFGARTFLLELLELGQSRFKGAAETLLVQALAGEQVEALIKRFCLG